MSEMYTHRLLALLADFNDCLSQFYTGERRDEDPESSWEPHTTLYQGGTKKKQ